MMMMMMMMMIRNQEGIVKGVSRYKLPDDVNIESAVDDDLHSDNIESDGASSSNNNPFLPSPTNQSINSDNSWEPTPSETVVNNNINNDNIIANDGDDDDINDDYSGPVWGTAEEFMDAFFNHTYCNKFEEVRKAEAAVFVPSMDDSFIKQCLDMIDGAPKLKTPETRKHTLLKWTQATQPKRLIMFMSKKQLGDLADSLDLTNKMSWTGQVIKLKNRLADLINDLQYDGLDGDAEDKEDDTNGTSNNPSYHSAFLETSFMSPLKVGKDEGQTKFQRFGHRAEKERLDEFFNIWNNISPLGDGIEAIYQPGLVHRQGRFYLRDSSDGVALMEGCGVIPIEIKTRCSNRTYQRERQNIQANKCCKLYDNGSSDVVIADVFSHMESSDGDDKIGPVNPLLHKLIPDSHERFILMHSSPWQVGAMTLLLERVRGVIRTKHQRQ
jgi:hypothetical protein